ncbi:hypothetical protein CkaCkLH20_02157 [Colletotrichum karsti]|uniref:YDG domain-containing protein n=1 Tax=Colletotrichum karsti TaxID=1095194 RepID=A0A9P6IC83_9PEZI|nr:uncharacterized protein CkaCkLH20_02157 [Colletotrichum karsti]KAF9880203.1 hypothetical protein CkaCkLH20_02157 [Colletotrichum karsti]
MASLDPKFILGPGALHHLNTSRLNACPQIPGGVGQGRDPIGSYFTLTNTQTIDRLGALSRSRNMTQETTSVLNMKKKLRPYLDYLQRCQAYYGLLVPQDFYDARETLFRGLRKIFHQEFVTKQRLFTNQEKRRAKNIYNWAQGVAVAPEQGEIPGETTALVTTNSSGRSEDQPPSRHPIWGIDGIMYGLALLSRTPTRYCLDSRYKGLKRSADVYGDNGFEVGAWFPYQKSAVFFGAHGDQMAGIGFKKSMGSAFSVVVSGTYEKVDKDEGNIIFYSAPGSMDKKDFSECNKTTPATDALFESSKSKKPVRVLRKAIKSESRGSIWTPKEGLRYDGLYRVNTCRIEFNDHQCPFFQFELERLENQKPLGELCRIPTTQQLKDYRKIAEFF